MYSRRREPPPIPPGVTRNAFGKEIMRWGRNSDEARARMNTLTREELRAGGVTLSMAKGWRDFYLEERVRIPQNPSAAGRAELMQKAVDLLSEDE